MKKRVWIILIIIVILACGGAYAWKEYHRKPESLTNKTEDLSISAKDLLLEFQGDENKANSQYLDKIILVHGTVEHVLIEGEVSSIVLSTDDPMSTVICELESGYQTNLKAGEHAQVKGQCTGYLMDIVLVKSVVIE